MKEEYVSITEAARLENVPYNTLRKRINRNPRKYLTKLVTRPEGGRPLVYVALSSLLANRKKSWKPDRNGEWVRSEIAIVNAIMLMNAILKHRDASERFKDAFCVQIQHLAQNIIKAYSPGVFSSEKEAMPF